MRIISAGIGMTALLLASLQNGKAEVVITAQDYAVDSDAVLESTVKEIKSVPQDTVNVIGDALKMVSDESVTAAKGVAAVFKPDPVAAVEKRAALETARAWDSANQIQFRSYKISDLVGGELACKSDFERGASVDVSGFFDGVTFPKGTSAVYRPDFKKLFVWQTPENMLAIETVLAEQNNAQRELMGKQVEIETKFIEVSQNTLKELGFNWRFESKNGGAANLFENLSLPAGQDILAAGLRSAGTAFGTDAASGALLLQKASGSLRWSMIINALEQAEDSDVLSAPSLTTMDGKTAGIWVGEQRKIPTEFSSMSQNTSLFVEHRGWQSELVGVQLEVTPELRGDGLINLNLKPRVMDLIGYDTYQVTPSNASMIIWARQSMNNMQMGGRFPVVSQLADGTLTSVGKIYNSILSNVYGPGTDINDVGAIGAAAGSTGQYNVPMGAYQQFGRAPQHDIDGLSVPQLTGNLPYFRLREMETSVAIADGSTLGMGGLIYDKLETYRDKVPVLGSIPLLGRLFRSEGERSIKRNLMIFVTATQVDVNGRKASDLAMKNNRLF